MGRNQNSIFVSENGEAKKSGNGVCHSSSSSPSPLFSSLCYILSNEKKKRKSSMNVERN